MQVEKKQLGELEGRGEGKDKEEIKKQKEKTELSQRGSP